MNQKDFPGGSPRLDLYLDPLFVSDTEALVSKGVIHEVAGIPQLALSKLPPLLYTN